jgi:predicted nucleic acid-binding Zn ribbon protein
MDHDEQLRRIAQWKKPQPLASVRLGTVLEKYVQEQVAPKYEQFSAVEEAWRQVIPDELAQHCRCDGVSAGSLKIIVDSPAYMYKLQMVSSELLEGLEQLCRRQKIRKLKFVPGFAAM